MIRDPDLIHYFCIARGTTILAELKSTDAAIVANCLEKTPPYHSIFTHTIRSKTYAYLMDEDFVYFSIFDEKFGRSEGLGFLKKLRDAFFGVVEVELNPEKLSAHCFQEELNPTFRQLLCPRLHLVDGIESPRWQCGSGPIRERVKVSEDYKKKNRSYGESTIGRRNGEEREEQEASYNDDSGLIHKYPSRNGAAYSTELMGHQNRARRVWKTHVWVVLSLDLMICVILFAVWLWVCRGLKCIDT